MNVRAYGGLHWRKVAGGALGRHGKAPLIEVGPPRGLVPREGKFRG